MKLVFVYLFEITAWAVAAGLLGNVLGAVRRSMTHFPMSITVAQL